QGSERDPIQDVVFVVHEGGTARVVAREYPCLTGDRSAQDVSSEIDSFLSELPGGRPFDTVDPRIVDEVQGSAAGRGQRAPPDLSTPWTSYVPEVYERATKHVQDLYRAEGYLSALVGPVQVLRRACALRSPAGQCIPIGERPRLTTACRYDAIGLPLEDAPLDPSLSCVPDPAHGVHCEPSFVVRIPVKLGPRSYLYDLGFEGNQVILEKELATIAALELGQPV